MTRAGGLDPLFAPCSPVTVATGPDHAARSCRSATEIGGNMSSRTQIAGLTAAALSAASLVVALSGQAAGAATRGGGSFVYSKGGNIHLARADGSHDIVFKKGGWYWPSMDNHGVIAAEREDKTAPDGTLGYTIHRFRQ